MTRFNIAALQEQGMSPEQINAYIAEQEAAIFGGPRGPKGGPKGGGGVVTPTSLETPRPVPEPGKSGTGYDIGAPMPGPATQTPGGTRSDLGKPGLADLGKPGADIMAPRPPKDENQPDRSIPESGDFQNLLDKRKKRKEEQPQETPNSRIPRKKTAKLDEMAGEEGGSRFQKMLDRIKQISS